MGLTEQIGYSIEKLKKALQEQEFRIKQVERLRALCAEAEAQISSLEAERALIEKALHLIVETGDMIADDSYRFITKSVNSLLDKMFTNCSRSIRLTQKMVGKNPTLAVEIITDGVVRDLSECGHGIQQIISLVCIICLIVLNDSRRIVVLDEVLSGVQEQNRAALSEALWAFTEIGFQFITCDSAFIPEGAKVFNFINEDGVSRIDNVYFYSEIYSSVPDSLSDEMK